MGIVPMTHYSYSTSVIVFVWHRVLQAGALGLRVGTCDTLVTWQRRSIALLNHDLNPDLGAGVCFQCFAE